MQGIRISQVYLPERKFYITYMTMAVGKTKSAMEGSLGTCSAVQLCEKENQFCVSAYCQVSVISTLHDCFILTGLILNE
jgi:hypothetical protein